MGEIVKGLMTSLLASQWPLVAVAVLCVAAGWLARGIVGKKSKDKKNNNAGSQIDRYRTENMEGHRIEHGNEDSENKAVTEPGKENVVAEPDKENGIVESLNWVARNIAKNKGNVFDLKEIWIDAIEPVVNISMELRTKIKKSGIICSALIEAKGISKEGKEWSLYISDDDIVDKGELYKRLDRQDISDEIVQISIEIKLFLTFVKIEERNMLSIKGTFYKPGERIIGEWKDNRYFMDMHGETKQPSRKGYDRDGIYEMLEEQVKKAIEDWRKESC